MGVLAWLVSVGVGLQISERISSSYSAIMSKLLLLAVALVVVMVTEVYSVQDCAQTGLEPTWHYIEGTGVRQCTCVTYDECDPSPFGNFCWSRGNNRRSCSTNQSCGCIGLDGICQE